MSDARPSALWIAAPGKAELREVEVEARVSEVEVKTLFSGISRGTEALVLAGAVPEGEHATMRAPFQDGEFTFPVKYGYAAVGEVQNTDREGQIIFALFPHQTRFSVPSAAAFSLPANVPPERAVLAANMETALNILWDAGAGPGDRIAVVGCGVVGALAGYLAARIPGAEVTLIDKNPAREALARHLGCGFATPETPLEDADIVVHASASEAGLSTAIECAGLEATIVEASWYGTRSTNVPLGGRFHQRRLRIVGSQVGRVPPHRAPRWDFGRRLTKAISLLEDPRLDRLISSESAFDALPRDYAAVLADPDTLCHRVRYAP
ncbi:zinc-dependent alcohol dehydrogenase [Marivita hallyeonensis]|uniref:Threonine dehydrogenase n=1 Tax=Marivita hallyeonensis TaxID=996342 RepID=A0A1M5S6T7_9RHOB|nr:zinc-binding alcohol dehydrogenase [Marivita hallyeonensis]SHH34155.1 hypothetical protein SAMN05443551_2024 [Marivita hallyeonensis]